MKLLKDDDGPLVSIKAPAIDVKWLCGVTFNTVSEVENDYRRYCSIIDDDAGHLADRPADVVDDLDSVFLHEAL